MDTVIPTLNDLFAQLGLPSETADIDRFIATHNPLPDSVPLADAPFWTPAQAAFLKEEVAEDSEWAELVENLSVRLRAPASEPASVLARDSV